jgi:dCMP deaminase
MAKSVLLVYVPTPHSGYEKLFSQYLGVDIIYIWGQSLIDEVPHLRKDIHALSPLRALQSVRAWEMPVAIEIAEQETLRTLQREKVTVFVPDEDIYHELCPRYLLPEQVTYKETTFLRWNRDNSLVNREITPSSVIAVTSLDLAMLREAERQSRYASDWWRGVGAVISRDGVLLLAGHNHHLPTDYTPYINGNPRNTFKRGLHLELTSDIHAEVDVIAVAACEGISLRGAFLYVTTFPCPPCAKLIARAGFSRCYYSEGYAVLDGEQVLRDHNVDLIRVALE